MRQKSHERSTRSTHPLNAYGTAYYPAGGFDESGLDFISASYPGVTKVLHVDPAYASPAVHQGRQRTQSIWVPGDAVSFSVKRHLGEQAAVVLLKTAGDFGSLMSDPGFVGNTVAQLRLGGDLVNSSGWGGKPVLGHLPLELIGLQRTGVRGTGLEGRPIEVLQKVSEVAGERVTELVELDRALMKLLEDDFGKLAAKELVARVEALLERGSQLGVRAQTEGALWRALSLEERREALPAELAQFKNQLSKPALSADLTRRVPEVLSDIPQQSKGDLATWMRDLSNTLLEDTGALEDRFSRWQARRSTLTDAEEVVHGQKLDELERALKQQLTASALARIAQPFVDAQGRPSVPVFDVPIKDANGSGPARDLLFAVQHQWISRDAVEKVLQERMGDLKLAVAADPSLSKLFRSLERNDHGSPEFADRRWGVAALYLVLQVVRGFDLLKPADVEAILGKPDEDDRRDLRRLELSGLVSDFRYDRSVQEGTIGGGNLPKLPQAIYSERQEARAAQLRIARGKGELAFLNSFFQEAANAILGDT